MSSISCEYFATDYVVIGEKPIVERLEFESKLRQKRLRVSKLSQAAIEKDQKEYLVLPEFERAKAQFVIFCEVPESTKFRQIQLPGRQLRRQVRVGKVFVQLKSLTRYFDTAVAQRQKPDQSK